jgi:hypothetical protein
LGGTDNKGILIAATDFSAAPEAARDLSVSARSSAVRGPATLGSSEDRAPDPPGVATGEMLRHARAERIGDNSKFGNAERIHQVVERVGRNLGRSVSVPVSCR